MKNYLQKFGDDFKFAVKLLVQWNIEAAGILKDDPEVLNHVRLSVELQKTYTHRALHIRKVCIK